MREECVQYNLQTIMQLSWATAFDRDNAYNASLWNLAELER